MCTVTSGAGKYPGLHRVGRPLGLPSLRMSDDVHESCKDDSNNSSSQHYVNVSGNTNDMRYACGA